MFEKDDISIGDVELRHELLCQPTTFFSGFAYQEGFEIEGIQNVIECSRQIDLAKEAFVLPGGGWPKEPPSTARNLMNID